MMLAELLVALALTPQQRTVPCAEMIDRLTEDVGGENNAYTTADVTVYHETVPSNYLETLLWAEADRMANLNVDGPNFRSERSVVKEEYRQHVLTPPYGRLRPPPLAPKT